MSFDIRGVLGDAWAMWRTDRDLLLRIAGVFIFLPQYALTLLVPAMPPLLVTSDMGETEQMALAKTVAEWISAYGGWYLLAALLLHAGSLVLLLLYLRGADTGEAMRHGVRLLPRYVLAMIVVGLPLGIGVLTLVLLVPGLYVLGRLIALGPVLAAEQPIGVRRGMGRSWRLSRGHGLVLAGLVSLPLVGSALLSAPFTMIAGWERANSPNPVSIALAEAFVAAVLTAAMVFTILLQIAAYRRLVASSGT